MPTNHHSLTLPLLQANSNQNELEQEKHVETEEENYCFILNQHSSSITHSNKLSMSTRCLQQQQPVLGNKEDEILKVDDKLSLPRPIRSLKRRTSLLEKSRDWVNSFFFPIVEKSHVWISQARRLIALHRMRRNTLSNGKMRESFYQSNKKHSFPESLHHYQKSFDEDGYLSPMDIKAKVIQLRTREQRICIFCFVLA